MSAERILIVMHDFAGGGTEHVAIRLANEWVRQGRTVRLFCGSEQGPTRARVGPGVSVAQAAPALPRSLLSRALLGSALVEQAREWRPDIIFGTGNFHLPVLAAYAACRGRGVPTVCKLSNTLRQTGVARLASGVHAMGLRALTHRIDALIAMSPALRREAIGILRRPDILVAPEPILGSAAASRRIRLPGAPLILCAGRLEAQKNFGLALRAFAHLPRDMGATLRILGEGSRRASLERLARRLGIADRVEMLGHAGDIGAHLREASVFLCTSAFEGYPAVLVEAIAAGTPVITTNCSPAIGEIVEDGRQGDVVRHDPIALAIALMRWMGPAAPRPGNRQDRHRRHHVAWAAGTYLRLLDRIVDAPARASSRPWGEAAPMLGATFPGLEPWSATRTGDSQWT